MNEIYQKKYSLIELWQLTFGYLKAKYWFYLPLVLLYLLVFSLSGINLLNFVYNRSLETIAWNAAMVAFIQDVNSSGTQVFVLIQLILKIIEAVIIPLTLVLLGLALLHSFVMMMIFISQDLYVRKSELKIGKMLFHCLKRSFSLILTDLLLWLYYALLFVVFIAIVIASQFFITLTWISQLLLLWSLFICIFAIDWCYTYQAVYKYPLNGHGALRYSSLLIKTSFKDTVIWVASSGSIFLLLAYSFINMLANSAIEGLPVAITLSCTALLFYNFLTKLYTNFLFLNKDYLARQKKSEDDIYPDLISKNIAPIKVTAELKELTTDPRRSVRWRAAGAIMRHRYQQPEVPTSKTQKEKNKKKNKKKNKLE